MPSHVLKIKNIFQNNRIFILLYLRSIDDYSLLDTFDKYQHHYYDPIQGGNRRGREKTIKLPPRKRGWKLTVRQIRSAVRKVVRERLEWEAREAAEQADATLSRKNKPLFMEIYHAN